VSDDSSGGILKSVWDVFQCECHQSENTVRQVIELRSGASFETILEVIHALIPMR